MIAPDKARYVLEICRLKKLRLATVESCTGGMIIASLTDIAGSSDVIECGFITYSNRAKIDMVGVDPALISIHGAVSKPVAVAMAEGALLYSNADIAISTTGIAGPGGGTNNKPVGLVHMAIALKGNKTNHFEFIFKNDGREKIRQQAVLKALECLLARLEDI